MFPHTCPSNPGHCGVLDIWSPAGQERAKIMAKLREFVVPGKTGPNREGFG